MLRSRIVKSALKALLYGIQPDAELAFVSCKYKPIVESLDKKLNNPLETNLLNPAGIIYNGLIPIKHKKSASTLAPFENSSPSVFTILLTSFAASPSILEPKSSTPSKLLWFQNGRNSSFIVMISCV